MNPNDRPSNALLPVGENPPEITQAFEVLAKLGENDVPRIPESLFVQHLLPMLAAPPGTKIDLTRWLDVAGTPLRAIDIANDATGEILFRVPPLMRSLPTVFQQEVNYGNIIVETQARYHVHPNQADNYLQHQLAKVKTGATLIDMETAKQWNDIRARYNLPPLPLLDEHGNLFNAGGQVIGMSDGALTLSDEDDDVPFF
jgi:hypothetical protein